MEKDLSRFLGAADMSDRWDDGGDDYDGEVLTVVFMVKLMIYIL